MKKRNAIVNGRRGAVEAENKAASEQQELAQNVSILSAVQKEEKYDGKKPVTFTSRYGRHRIQITAPADIYNPATGRIVRGRPKVAQFDNYTFTTSDVEIVESLRAHRLYGFELFEAAVMQQAADDAVSNQILSQIEANPSVRSRVLAVLEGKKFPTSKTPQATV